MISADNQRLSHTNTTQKQSLSNNSQNIHKNCRTFSYENDLAIKKRPRKDKQATKVTSKGTEIRDAKVSQLLLLTLQNPGTFLFRSGQDEKKMNHRPTLKLRLGIALFVIYNSEIYQERAWNATFTIKFTILGV